MRRPLQHEIAATSLGILGGSFNPPHLGHLAVARQARDQLDLERVLLMPAHSPPHKHREQDPGPEHRLRMCRLAVDSLPGLSACALEIERGGTSYTIDTLRAVHAGNPQARLTFIVGADMARTLPTWREPQALLELADLAVAERDGGEREELLDVLATLSPRGRLEVLDMPPVEVSSSLVRARVARGDPVESLVGAPVASYISEHRLYRESVEVEIP